MRKFWRRRTEADFAAEIQSHLELEADGLVEDGISPDEAERAARRSFGNVTAARERFYEASRWMWLEQFWQDVRYALRVLLQSPAFLATAVLTLAVGLGLVTVAFTVFNAYVLRPFAVREPSALHQVGWRSHDDGGQSFTSRDYAELRGRQDLFDAVIADDTRFMVSEGRTLSVAFVSDNYFDALGPRTLLGRAFTAVDSRAPVVVLSEQLWARAFASDPAVLGREIDLDGRAFVVIGVVRADFTGLDDNPRDLWAPLSTFATLIRPDLFGANEPRHLEVIGRLRNGVTPLQAQAALTPFMMRMVDPKKDARDVRADVHPQGTANPLSWELLAVLSPIFAALALVLVTACANVSNVMLARAVARRREIAVRLSLGASRSRVVRQLLTEGLLVALLAGAAGLGLAAWALRAGVVMLFQTLPPSFAALLRVVPLGFDHRVFLFSLGVASLTTVLFALLPSLQASRLELTDALRGDRTGTGRGSKLRNALVIGQVAVSLVLVIVAFTLARNGAAVGAIDLGYETAGVQSINVRGHDDGAIGRLATTLATDPRIAVMAITNGNPLFERTRAIAAAPAGGTAAVPTRYTFVSPEYFSLLEIPMVAGRGFRHDEARVAAPVAIVSAATARAFWPGEDPVGQTVRIERAQGRPVDEIENYARVTVIGVARDVVSGMLIDGRDTGHLYLPTNAADAHAAALLVRGRTADALTPESMRATFRQVAPDPEVFEMVPLDDMKAAQAYPLRAASWVGSFLGAVALALSVSGLYGVLAYMLHQRTREIGIRMALGATAGAVVGLIMRQAARLAGVGAVIGLVVVFVVLQMLNAVIRLENVSLLDAISFVGGLGVVIAATALASYHPARRATRVEPSLALRADV